MHPIPQLIFNLLADRQRVVLPGLGTLYTEFSPASVDPCGDLSAPGTRVLFTSSEESGPTLPEVIAERSGVPLKEIRPQYNRWIEGLRKAATDGEVAIEGVALLLRQPDSSYWAHPTKELDALLNPSDRKSIRLPAPLPPKVHTQKTAHPKNGGKKTPTGKNTRNPKRRAVRFATGGAALVALFFAGYFAITHRFFDPNVPEATSVSRPERSGSKPPILPLPDSLSDTPESLVDTTLQDSLADGAAKRKEPAESGSAAPTVDSSPDLSPADPSGDVYHIIAGVFSNRENAERFLREGNFDPSRTTLIPTTGGRYMVSIGRFTDKERADAEMRRIQAAIPQAWISKRKK